MNTEEGAEEAANEENSPEARAERRRKALEQLIDHGLFTAAITIAVTRAPGGKLHIVTSHPHYHSQESLAQFVDMVYVIEEDTPEKQKAGALEAAGAMVNEALRTLDDAMDLMVEKMRRAAAGNPGALSIVSEAVAEIDALRNAPNPSDN